MDQHIDVALLRLENWLYNDETYTKDELKTSVKAVVKAYRRVINEKNKRYESN